MAEKTKQCSKCKEQKLLSEFYKSKRDKYGVRSSCKKCTIVCVQKYNHTHKAERAKYRQAHKVEIAKRMKDYRKTIIGSLRDRFETMKQRCNNPKHPRYKNYGGRGIKCLFKSSQEFVDYVINELQIDPRKLQVDRTDNDGNYEPGNIRFVTAKVNSNNRKRK